MIAEWRMSPDVDRWQVTHPTLTIYKQGEWFEKISGEKDSLYFVISDKNTLELVGLISLTDIDTLGGGQINIYLGNPKYYGKGYSQEAYILLLDMAFNQLGRENVYARVKKDNVRARAFHKEFGFLETEMWEKDMVWIYLGKIDYLERRQRMVSLIGERYKKGRVH